MTEDKNEIINKIIQKCDEELRKACSAQVNWYTLGVQRGINEIRAFVQLLDENKLS